MKTIDNNIVFATPAVLPDGNERLLIGTKQAAAMLSIGRSHFYGLHSSGRLGPMPIKLGKRSLWDRKELAKWVSAGCPSRQEWQRSNGNEKS